MSEPYVIRGHHLGAFADLHNERRMPEEFANNYVARMKAMKRGQDGDNLYFRLQPAEARKAYGQDIVGSKRRDAKLVGARLLVGFTKFMELNPEDQIRLTTGEKDSICNSCAIGQHCTETSQELAVDVGGQALQMFEAQIPDMRAIDSFIRKSHSLQKGGLLDPAICEITVDQSTRTAPSSSAVPVEQSKRVVERKLPVDSIVYQDPIIARADHVKTVLDHWYKPI